VTSAHLLEQRAVRSPDRPAVFDGASGVTMTYGELAGAVRALADGLSARGVGPGDVVTMQLPNWWEAVVVFHAAAHLGAVLNPIVPIYREHEVKFILGQANPKVVIVPETFRGFDHVGMALDLTGDDQTVVVVRSSGDVRPGVVTFEQLLTQEGDQPLTEVAAESVALLLYTSGTTAEPKGVLHSHQTLGYEVQSLIDLFQLGADDQVFMPSPVTHITGLLFGLLMPVMTGCAVSLLDVWSAAAAVDIIESRHCRFIMGATPFLHGLVAEYQSRGQSSELTVFLCGGADVPPGLVRLGATVLDCHVARVYGSSEFPTFCCGGPQDDVELCADTDGRPIGAVRGRLAAPVEGIGELLVKGPELFLGYLDAGLDAEAFTEDGYFRTGDLASIRADGAITIHGRSKDIILRGGENISAKQVEDMLHEHPMITAVAVVAMPDPIMVERACAFVVPAAGATPTLADLTGYLAQHHLAVQKFPERLELVAELPMTSSGKVLKHVLRAQARALVAHTVSSSTSLEHT
jgi:cyclohexanecarboxylate-CoA ligase